VRAARALVIALCMLPAALLAWRAATGNLTANPIEFITLETGFWALTLLMLTLTVSPLRRITGWNRIIAFRRILGLAAFGYATLHLLTYVTLDRFFDFSEIGADIIKRPYITVGFAAFVLLVPLAVTSTRGWIRRLRARWQLLHRLVYPAAALAVLHFYWKKSAKADVAEPLLFAGILAVLLLARLGFRLTRKRPRTTPRRPALTSDP
jgi:methionine sulfoxide reductase heme-binding subunit